MKWFQIHTNCLYDPKIIKLIKKHGIAGFGVYMAINVLIAEKDADDYSLEHDIDGLITLFNEPKTEEMLESCISFGLLTRDEFLIIKNNKLSKYIGNWQRRSKTTEDLQSPYRGPTAKKEEKEGRERKKEEKETGDIKSPINVKGSRPTASELFDAAEKLAKAKKINGYQ